MLYLLGIVVDPFIIKKIGHVCPWFMAYKTSFWLPKYALTIEMTGNPDESESLWEVELQWYPVYSDGLCILPSPSIPCAFPKDGVSRGHRLSWLE